ncbi:ATP-dependent DNA helicase [Paenibacillus sp. IB182496]|uniref:ATP-dependent DNA helicase n=1 Tax=Paenibacillus sabuli TaxID=2772509 RepID=A0A927BU77_9BACL|nr:ATP-dependent DNA helicase [Paenibacillus sabuli]MBD2846913.1 ATP-dependent DNA helicase [Paenibacillus sabuli]
MARYPFAYDRSRPYMEQAGEWIADVLYERLPAAGFEVREEQIYMAYQLERAFTQRKTIFAEAGVGTGKTIVYLLYSLCYARYTGKPAIVACADESLIEQLLKPGGDLAKLERHLGLSIDARAAKAPEQYLCLDKLDYARLDEQYGTRFEALREQLPPFARQSATMQAFYPYGDRKDYPELDDAQWEMVNWDAFHDCLACPQRHRCGQTLSRAHTRAAADLIICSHDFYMEHVWTREARRREGQLPLLPEHGAVVFDEGHLLEAAAQKALTYKLRHDVFEELITRLLHGRVRKSLALRVDETIAQSETVFGWLQSQSRPVAGSERMQVLVDERLRTEMRRFRELLAVIEEELVYESGLFTLDDYQLRIVEEHLEMMQHALGLFERQEELICWVSGQGPGLSLAIMPMTVRELLQSRVFDRPMPVVFSSATLSVEGSFDYMAHSLGVGASYLSFSVPPPDPYGSRMTLVAPQWTERSDHDRSKMKAAERLLIDAGGRTLLLFPSREQLARFRQELIYCPDCAGLLFLFEGDREISHLIDAFERDESSVLCAVSLWEGLDIPGPSLSQVIVWSLPFPPHDPVFIAKRSRARDPYAEVDLPYMLLRLRQGIGRLIRSRDDRGTVAILSEELQESRHPVRASIEAVLPPGARLRYALA